MFLTAAARVLVASLVLTSAVPAAAAEKIEKSGPPAPAAAAQVRPTVIAGARVSEAWRHDRRESSTAFNTLFVSYGALSGLDMYSTIKARNNGAREVNPLLDTDYTQAALTKALLTAGTYAAVRSMTKKNKKAGITTMVVLNAVMAGVVVNNFRNARR